LASTFADQAMIAIENARLFNQVQARTKELTESLEQQTATSEVLRVISRSPFDLQAVLDTLVESAARVCRAERANIARLRDDGFQFVAFSGFQQEYKQYMTGLKISKVDRGSITGRTVLEGRTVHIPDVLEDPEFTWFEAQKRGGFRTGLGVPLIREGTPIGVFFLTRPSVDPFTQRQIELVEIFADQAVIAIENARLFDEVQTRTRDLSESLEQQTATSEVLKVISRSAFELQTVLDTLVESAARLCGADHAFLFRRAGELYWLLANHSYAPEFQKYFEEHPIQINRGSLTGRTALEAAVVHIPDALADPEYAMTDLMRLDPFRTMLGVPLLREGNPIGVFTLTRATVSPFSQREIQLVSTFADQAVIAIENVRLFEEIRDKSNQLEIASQHKSQFLANMSHELRTPLNAILGYTELILDSIYGEPPEKMRGVLERLQANGKHLLNLINDVLDLSKIEAGQLTLDLGDYSLTDVVHTVVTAVEPLATSKALPVTADVSKELPTGHGDGRRLAQVLLNLVGNAIKFTDQGQVTINANASDGEFTVAVCDTGPGISLSDQAKLFQEFQQADNSITRQKGGTGLGLAISKRIIEMHGGRIWVESEIGNGAKFTFTVPVRAQQQVANDG
jgi:signal transduction histidine kinase